MIFFIKKLITSVLNFPGNVLLIQGIILAFLIRKKEKKLALLLGAAAFTLYLFSTSLVSSFFIRLIETGGYPPDAYAECDVIVVLGGGINEGVSDLTGNEVPSAESQARIINAVRLYKLQPRPVIVSGGIAGKHSAEAPVLRRFLTELGVESSHVIVETESRDTFENAEYVKKIIEDRKFTKAALVTSAFHLKRASILFRNKGIDFIPCPSLPYGENNRFSAFALLPGSSQLRISSIALKEILGILCYSILL